MSTFTFQDGTRIYYKDWGEGQPVVFSHGWPLSADAWESQMVCLASEGYRTSAHDRRGHGRSSQPSEGNDIDTYADDLAELIEALDLQDVILIGDSTGGGEEGGQAYARWLRRSGGGGYDQGRNQGGSLRCATEPRRGAGGRVLLDA